MSAPVVARPSARVGAILLGVSVLLWIAQSTRPAAAQVEVPPIPDAAPVTVDPTTTALLVLDFSQSNCSTRPACVASLPAVAGVMARARDAGIPVIHSVGNAPVLPEVAPAPDEPRVTSGPDKFFRTDLDQILKDRGIETMLITGTAANGAVLYTAFGAAQRGYTVVVLDDGISSSTDFATMLTRWQLLNGPGTTNPENKPLEKARVTLSRSDLVSIQP